MINKKKSFLFKNVFFWEQKDLKLKALQQKGLKLQINLGKSEGSYYDFDMLPKLDETPNNSSNLQLE